MTKVYLSGKMSGRSGREVLTERRRAIELCLEHNLTPLDPGKNEQLQDTEEIISISIDYPTMKSYVAKDEYAIDNADAMLVLTGDTVSDGTWLEFGQAIHKCHIPVVMVAPRRVKGEIKIGR